MLTLCWRVTDTHLCGVYGSGVGRAAGYDLGCLGRVGAYGLVTIAKEVVDETFDETFCTSTVCFSDIEGTVTTVLNLVSELEGYSFRITCEGRSGYRGKSEEK